MKLKIIGAFFVFAISASPTFAHVVVRPDQVGVGARTNFAVSVPSEGDTSTTQVRLIIPEGLESVRPNVKPDWNIQLIKTGEGENQKVSEIIWSGGNIPAEQRDEFVFSAMVPAEEKELIWKAYQTYAGGEVVAWDTDPKTVAEHSNGAHNDEIAPKPYSVTKVINDLQADSSNKTLTKSQEIKTSDSGSWVSWAALVLASVSLGLQFRKRVG